MAQKPAPAQEHKTLPKSNGSARQQSEISSSNYEWPRRDDALAATATYHRFHITTSPAPDLVPWPSRFKVRVNRVGLVRYMIKEFIHYRGDMKAVLSRPCVYGVFSRPVGGLAPIHSKCVGCLRCTTQHPDFVRIERNPAREQLGDSYFTAQYVDAISYEAETGSIPVKGAGYRGRFGGEGWDGMWTDMSEIVRPTRDGIHGREFISTVVDIGSKPGYLAFDPAGRPVGALPSTLNIPLPTLFDAPAVASEMLHRILAQAAEAVETLAILPLQAITESRLSGPHVVPLVHPAEAAQLGNLPAPPRMVEMDGWNEALYRQIQALFPDAILCLRIPYAAGEDLLRHAEAGVRVFHLTADYHGRGPEGTFALDLIRAAHRTFVQQGMRDQVTLLGSGGIIAAEHVPKAIIAGLDAVVLDTPLLVALQARFAGDFTRRGDGHCRLPERLTVNWGVQRLVNLMAAWHDQLLEILGAMGLREVRRLRGEIGRAMFQKALEQEAFAGIEGYDG